MLPGALFGQNPACIPSVTIHESENNTCMGTTVTFYATVLNDGTNGVYKWKKNNVDAGINSNASYTSADIHEGDVLYFTRGKLVIFCYQRIGISKRAMI